MNLSIKEYFLKIKRNTPILFWLYVGTFLSPFFIYGIWQAHDWLVNDGDLVVALSVAIPPHANGSNAKNNRGFDYSIAYFVAQRLHKNLKIKSIPFGKAISELNAGSVDLIGSLSITDERLANMAMVHVYGGPTPFITMTFLNSPFYEVLSSSEQAEVPIHKVKSLLKDAPVGIIVGSVWLSVLKKYAFNNFISYECESDMVSALESGKISAAVIGEFAANFLKKQNPNIQTLSIALDAPWSYGGGIAIKKGRADLIKNVTEVIQDLKDEGIIRQEQLRWFGRVCS